MSLIREHLEKIRPITDEEWLDFSAQIETKKFKRNEIILNFDQVEKYVYFVDKGIVRKYLYNKGEEFDIGFFFKNSFFSDTKSILTGVPSGFCTQAINEVEVSLIPKHHLFEMYEKYSNFNSIGRIIMEFTFLEVVNLWADSVSLTGEERYLKLQKTDPQLLKNIPIKYLSRYLGLHPNSLSRIRKKYK